MVLIKTGESASTGAAAGLNSIVVNRGGLNSIVNRNYYYGKKEESVCYITGLFRGKTDLVRPMMQSPA